MWHKPSQAKNKPESPPHLSRSKLPRRASRGSPKAGNAGQSPERREDQNERKGPNRECLTKWPVLEHWSVLGLS